MRLKNKKIAFYICLPHHSKYLFPLAEALRREGAEIFFFTTPDIYPFEGELLKQGLRYKFVTEYADAETIRRIRTVSNKFYDEWLHFCFTWDGIRHWPFFMQDNLFMFRIGEYICLERMTEAEKPDMFIALHEVNPWGKEIGHVAAKYGIPYVTLQEGDYYEDSFTSMVHTEYSTACLLWGDSSKAYLERHECSIDKLVVTGNLYWDENLKMYSRASSMREVRNELGIGQDMKVLAVLVGIDWAVITKKEIWQEFCKGLDRPELVCVFKWHELLPVHEFNKIEAVIKEIMPSAIVLYTYNPYKIISIADYCVVLGKTTLAVEALAWQRPLFEVPRDSVFGPESYYDKAGIAQLIWPLGDWEKLFDTMRHGLPAEMQRNVGNYVRRAFYKLDGRALERAASVISFILEAKGKKAVQSSRLKVQGPTDLTLNAVSGRVSFIVPSGKDAEALLSTLTSLSEGVKFPDWEAVIVVNDNKMKELLAGISGDLKIVEAEGDNLSQLCNRGAEASSGEFLVFMTPGIVYLKGEGLVESMKDGVAGIPIKNADMSPYCLGIGFDYNYTPYFMKEEAALDAHRDAVGGGFIGLGSEAFAAIGGFDEGIANHLTEVDICLAAKDKGYSITYLPDCLGVVYKNMAVEYWKKVERNGLYDEWKRRIRFFAKWCGKLPKDDDVIKYMGDWLKV